MRRSIFCWLGLGFQAKLREKCWIPCLQSALSFALGKENIYNGAELFITNLLTLISLITEEGVQKFPNKQEWGDLSPNLLHKMNNEGGNFERRGAKSWKTISETPCLSERLEYTTHLVLFDL